MENRNIIFIGLGKMGLNMAVRLHRANFILHGFDIDKKNQEKAKLEGIPILNNLSQIKDVLGFRIFWLMIPHKVVDETLKNLKEYLKKGDIVIDGGNSFYEDSIRRGKELKKKGILFFDAGISGGPNGAKNGACIMVGGEKKSFRKIEDIISTLSHKDSYKLVGDSGAGHFVKMIHNGIEYGMMQSIAEGFSVLQKSKYKLDLKEIAHLYNKGSVIASSLIGWLYGGFIKFGKDLRPVSAKVDFTGEGEWTIKTGKKMGIKMPSIEASLNFRKKSGNKKTFEGKILTTLRHMFGGHSFK